MRADEEPLLSLAMAVSDSAAVDWVEMERRAKTAEDRELVRKLRILAGIADAHEAIQSGGDKKQESPAVASKSAAASQWGRLELLEKIGEGSFGEVFRARDTKLDAEVALKLLFPDSPDHVTTLMSRVIHEGRLLARVRHRNVVTVYGADEHDGRVGIWTEFVRGRTLSDLLADQGPFGEREAAMIGVDLCRALAAVHGAGLVHRDVKAQNVMREQGGRIVLMDLGASVELAPAGSGERTKVSGTPLYMAPEIFSGASASARTDIYSLGVLLYQLVTGSFPLVSQNVAELREAHRRREYRLLRDVRPDLPAPFIEAVEKAISPDPDDRYATAGAFEIALARAVGAAPWGSPSPETKPGEGTRSRWTGLVIILAASLALAGAALFGRGWLPAPGEPGTPPKTDAGSPPGTEHPTKQTQPENASVGPHDPASAPTHPAGNVAVSAGSFTAEATFFRERTDGTREPLLTGGRLSVGDKVTLDFKASEPVYVYVANVDEQGRAYLLFPLPGYEMQNPLARSRTHRLPGRYHGSQKGWQADTAGGTERLLVVASRNRWLQFESELAALARPQQTSSNAEAIAALELSDRAAMRLRGLGGVADVPEVAEPRSSSLLFEMAARLQGRSGSEGSLWVREVDLENPGP